MGAGPGGGGVLLVLGGEWTWESTACRIACRVARGVLPMQTPAVGNSRAGSLMIAWRLLPLINRHACVAVPAAPAAGCCCRPAGRSSADCLYDTDIPLGVDYLHVQLVAKELPPLEFVQEVGRAASAFWEAHPDMHIAVHCAYGMTTRTRLRAGWLAGWLG